MHQSFWDAGQLPLDVSVQAELREAWGDLVDRREPGWNAIGGASAERLLMGGTPSQLRDRLDGRCLPLFETETDLATIRGEARAIGCLASCVIGAVESLCNYVMGAGFAMTAQRDQTCVAEPTAAQPVIDEVQRVINEFLDVNRFLCDFDREVHNSSREDGEAFLMLRSTPDGRIKVSRLDPAQVRQPANPRQLEDWLGCGDEFVSSWSFGVHTRSDEPDEPLGYHVIFDEQGANWDYVPAARMVHLKRNVPRQAKRGVSDLYPIIRDVEREAKIRRNTAEGAALQSAIAWIREHAEGTTNAGAQRLVDAAAVAHLNQSTAAGTRTRTVSRYAPGTILDVSPGMRYVPGPLGKDHGPNFIVVAQYILRSIGIRWLMPEYMISGDASNANYASTLVAESPFVKSREADQRFYAEHFHDLLWKVVRLSVERGRFEKLGVGFDEIERLVNIQINPPAVATRDELKQAKRQEILLRQGILSRRTAAVQNGLDFDQELQNGATQGTTRRPGTPQSAHLASPMANGQVSES